VADRHALVLGHGLDFDFADRCLEQAQALTPTDLQTAARSLLARPCLSLCGPARAITAAERVWQKHPLAG
jgi:hypothetical protein